MDAMDGTDAAPAAVPAVIRHMRGVGTPGG
jgi:hypothetical protein